jgi:hypothetical protein
MFTLGISSVKINRIFYFEVSLSFRKKCGILYRYGLLVPKKLNQGPLQPRLAVFGDNSDSDNEEGADWVKKALKVCVNMKKN